MGNYLSYTTWTQSFFVPTATLTEKNLPSQTGKVHIVTGGYAGIGEELTKILYNAGAKVYVAGRDENKGMRSISRIKAAYPNATGEIVYLHLDLSDLPSIKKSADEFLSKESRLDVLVNNAGVMFPPKGTKTKQDHDLQFGTNCLGPHLFTKFLHPILKQTASTAPPNSVRVIWAASMAIQVLCPVGGVKLDDSGKLVDIDQQLNYGQTKVGNVLLAMKTQELLKDSGIVSVSFNPGNLASDLQRHVWGGATMGKYLLYPARLGAYTELWSGWSEDVTVEKGVTFVMPWGRDGTPLVRKDITDEIEKGLVDKFWYYCESETRPYA